LEIANNQQNIVINVYQDFLAHSHSDVFQGQLDTGLFSRLSHSGKTWLSKQEEEEGEGWFSIS
jgi:hypothetical protein